MTSTTESPDPEQPAAEIAALAREIAERRTGMPAYLVDDEAWAAALEEAKATYEPRPPKSALAEAVDKARRIDPIAFIDAYNRARQR